MIHVSGRGVAWRQERLARSAGLAQPAQLLPRLGRSSYDRLCAQLCRFVLCYRPVSRERDFTPRSHAGKKIKHFSDLTVHTGLPASTSWSWPYPPRRTCSMCCCPPRHRGRLVSSRPVGFISSLFHNFIFHPRQEIFVDFLDQLCHILSCTRNLSTMIYLVSTRAPCWEFYYLLILPFSFVVQHNGDWHTLLNIWTPPYKMNRNEFLALRAPELTHFQTRPVFRHKSLFICLRICKLPNFLSPNPTFSHTRVCRLLQIFFCPSCAATRKNLILESPERPWLAMMVS